MLSGAPIFAQQQVQQLRPGHDGERIAIDDLGSGRYYPSLPYFHFDLSGRPCPGYPAPDRREWRLPVSDNPAISYGKEVSRNEFGCTEGVFPSPDSSLLAVYRKDESFVCRFPILDIRPRTATDELIPYPMAGTPSERLSLCICDTLGNVISTIVPDQFSPERYLTGVSWTADGKAVFVGVLDREQHNLHLNLYDARSGELRRTLLTESNDAWVEPLDPVRALDCGLFIYRTDNRDSFRNLYLCDTLGGIVNVAPTAADLEYVAHTEDARGIRIFYTTAQYSPVENHLMSVYVRKGRSLSKCRIARPCRLTSEQGWHDVIMSDDCSRFIDRWSSVDNPGCVALRSAADGSLLESLAQAQDPLADVAMPELEMGTTLAADGVTRNWFRLWKPVGYKPDGKYPLIVYVYGGPHSQLVQDRWLANVRMWELAMAQRGYAVYVQDNRGTSNRGAEFEKAINRRCGQEEMADQIAGLNALLERCPWIDRGRIGVHGWSYGGFMTISLCTSYPQVFKVAVAGGPVIDWKWYEVMYGERYMDTPQSNPEGYALTSLLDKADRLQAKMLICQGVIDPVVVWQHSLSFVQNCVELGVPVDYFPYPRSEHNMAGKARKHLYNKITDYFIDYL